LNSGIGGISGGAATAGKKSVNLSLGDFFK